MNVDADVLIVGGGPAGAAAAHTLARAGARTVVFERAPLPRDKICGDLLGTEAIATLRRLDFPQSVTAGATLLHGAVLHGPRGAAYGAAASVVRKANSGAARVIPRERLDAALLQASVAAGAVVRQESVVEILPADAEATVGVRTESGRYRARVLVGADGWGSLVARTLHNTPPDEAQVAVAVRAYARGVRGLGDRALFRQRRR